MQPDIPLSGFFVPAPDGQSYVVKNVEGYFVCFYERVPFFCFSPLLAKRFHDCMLAESYARLAMDLGAQQCTTVLIDGRQREITPAKRVRSRAVSMMPSKQSNHFVEVPDALQQLFSRAEANLLKEKTTPKVSVVYARIQVVALCVIALCAFIWMLGRVTGSAIQTVQQKTKTAVHGLTEVPRAK